MVRKKTLMAFMVVVSMALVMTFTSSSFAWKAIKPVVGPDKKVTSWQDVDIPDDRVPIGVDELKDAVGVFGYPEESMGLSITPEQANVNTAGWDARAYVQLQTSFLGMEIKPLKDYAGDFQFDLIDAEGRIRTRKVYQFRKPYYGEG
ncbi:MAG: hypothetical protein V2A69_11575, partial [Pseudomonadota bacterium]